MRRERARQSAHVCVYFGTLTSGRDPRFQASAATGPTLCCRGGINEHITMTARGNAARSESKKKQTKKDRLARVIYAKLACCARDGSRRPRNGSLRRQAAQGEDPPGPSVNFRRTAGAGGCPPPQDSNQRCETGTARAAKQTPGWRQQSVGRRKKNESLFTLSLSLTRPINAAGN